MDLPEAPPPVEYARLAREIAMDIHKLPDLLRLHDLTNDQWAEIQENPQFQAMLRDMVREWQAAGNTKARIRIMAATGLESVLDTYLSAIIDPDVPLGQKVEAGKFLARLGELEENTVQPGAGGTGHQFSISISIGNERPIVDVQAVPSFPQEAELIEAKPE